MIERVRRAASRRARRRGRSGRTEDGFALMSVLAIIALTSITIAALLGMLITMIRITATQEQAARDARAADGAATAAINHLRMNQDDNTNACSGVPTAGMQVPFEDVGTTTDVQVTCRKAADEFGQPGGELKLVGSDYAGRLNWAGWPWAGVPVSVAGATPSLVSSGGGALQFNGNVNTSAGAAPLRTDTGGTPAVEVRGKYTQGAAGLGASSGCGVLDGAGVRPATAVVASAGTSCGDPSLIPVAVSQDYAIDPAVPAELPLPTACPSQRVIRFSPGRYDQTAVATLNSWFSRTGGCTNKTFHFEQGRYWFDANTTGAPAGDRHALIFDNPTSSFVFGTSSGWSTDPATGGAMSADFPNACLAGTAADTGASIILSARTELRHLSGRLSVCPYTSPTGTQYPTLLQQTTVPTAITVSNPQSSAFLPPANLISGSPSAVAGPRTMACTFGFLQTTCTTPPNAHTFSVDLSSALAGPLSSVVLQLTGDEVNHNVSVVQARRVSFRVVLANGQACDVPAANGLPDAGTTTTYQLKSGGCASVLTDGSQLQGAQVQANISYTYNALPCTAGNGCPTDPQRLSLWNVGVVANTWVGNAATAAPTAEWNAIDNVRADDTAAATLRLPCGQPVCGNDGASSIERSFDLSGFGNAGTTLSPEAHVDSFGIQLKQQGSQASGVNLSSLPGQTQLSLRLANGVTCNTTYPGVPNMAGTTYFPMLTLGGAACGAQTLGPADLTGSNLIGSQLSVKVRLDCLGILSVTCNAFLTPVAFQHVGLVATTDTYTGPVVQSRLTIDAANGTSANFFGPAYLKRTALDLHWNGAASGASIFGGEVQLHSLGSVAAVGATTDVVCCTAPEIATRKVRVTSWIDGRPKLTVVAALDRVGGMPSILDWTVCGRNGTCANP